MFALALLVLHIKKKLSSFMGFWESNVTFNSEQILCLRLFQSYLKFTYLFILVHVLGC